uniref:30S ribosomal protein S5P n=1 Tax=uncultured euryarchaeote Rifle_16ft_4_minimus_25120 TaxID=1665191 RepID=A0A0H4T4U6_9EURY|nr:30S ribosomal protein S5P [uncultured euryarchaeote Rifle_16ft_4_minimus_25120]
MLKPAPQGVGLAVGDVAKSVLRLAGITDAWGSTRGHTKTTVNYALATFEALRNTGVMKIRGEQRERLKIKAGAEQVYVRTLAPTPEAGGAVELPEEIAVEGEDLVEGEKPADAAKEETEE